LGQPSRSLSDFAAFLSAPNRPGIFLINGGPLILSSRPRRNLLLSSNQVTPGPIRFLVLRRVRLRSAACELSGLFLFLSLFFPAILFFTNLLFFPPSCLLVNAANWLVRTVIPPLHLCGTVLWFPSPSRAGGPYISPLWSKIIISFPCFSFFIIERVLESTLLYSF